MATKYQGQQARTDLYRVDPWAVVLKEELRGRAFAPTDEQIEDLAISMLEVGQLQPSKARSIGENKLAIVAGFTRAAAARLIRTGFERDGVEYHDPEFLLQVTVSTMNDKESFLANVAENAIRNQTSPVDDAKNQRIARERYGLSNVEIANRYRCSVDKVAQLEKLLALDDAEQEAVHHGHLAVDAAVAIVDSPEHIRRELIATVLDGGRVSKSDVKAAKRNAILRDDDDSAATNHPVPASTKGLSRNLREVKQWWSDIDPTDEDVSNFRDVFLQWCAGTKTDKQLRNALGKIEKRL